ncbi:helix-turn-helix domain-containing protein [Trinickia fusca]|uniref:helix-turn-helix domain-containing protein n=1 Tax=Trinickia fusca TaxID=2419777 RepID=UPI001602FA8B|nr:helix-turn-helix domain-containing protein [Trinickia fusca]
MYPPDDPNVAFDAEMTAFQVDALIIGRRTWLNPSKRIAHRARRTERHLGKGDLDYYVFQFQLSEATRGSAGRRNIIAGNGDLVLLDQTSTIDLEIVLGDAIYLIVPREFMHRDLSMLHGKCLTGLSAGLLVDYMCSLSRRAHQLTPEEIPHVVQATRHLLHACVRPDPETTSQVDTEVSFILRKRIRSYIDENLFDPNLNVDQICKNVGVSRSTLYRLFESSNGIAHVIQERRLVGAHQELTNSSGLKYRISEIARRHGFVSENNFSRAYKTLFGHAPRDARKQQFFGTRSTPTAPLPLNADSALTYSAWIDHCFSTGYEFRADRAVSQGLSQRMGERAKAEEIDLVRTPCLMA